MSCMEIREKSHNPQNERHLLGKGPKARAQLEPSMTLQGTNKRFEQATRTSLVGIYTTESRVSAAAASAAACSTIRVRRRRAGYITYRGHTSPPLRLTSATVGGCARDDITLRRQRLRSGGDILLIYRPTTRQECPSLHRRRRRGAESAERDAHT